MKLHTNSALETQKTGAEFAKQLRGGDVVLLYGELGAGKTTFTQGVAYGLGIERRIISPTFIIVRKYEVPSVILGNVVTPESGSRIDSGQARMTVKTLYHIDLYRTQTDDDLKGLGLQEILEEKDAIVVIEWPEKLGSLFPKKAWEVKFVDDQHDERDVTIEK